MNEIKIYGDNDERNVTQICRCMGVRSEAGAASNSLKSTLMALVHAPHFTRRVQDQ